MLLCMSECMSVCMSPKKYLLRRCYLEWDKLPLLERGGFSQALFFPKQNALEFRDLRIATRGSASGLRELLKKFDQNFNAVRAGYVCGNAVVRSVRHAGRSAGSSSE